MMTTKKTHLLTLCLITFLAGTGLRAQPDDTVRVWEDTIVLPTYKMNPNDPNPAFFRHQSYQGASRVIYPYPLQDNFTSEKVDQPYNALFLENEYLKVCVLPEIGGRLFYATDKTDGYEMFYRQHVIKPASIGMTGAWISGGIEFCVFHHHRASSFMPVDYRLTENPDGSATIWIGEWEPRQRMKWTIGISLYPGKSYMEVAGILMNTTENINSFLYWANVATHVNEDYQIFFPPSTDFAVFHAKNSFTHWPITTEPYTGKEYYRNGVDASWWKNHPIQISFFAYDLKEGFLAGYDHGKHAGTVHVCNPNIVKGAKLWEWGPGAMGSMWDTKVLTDEDGPYAELMAGAYSDNQPDYSWIKPYEVKQFKQYWYPLREIKGVTNANLTASINLEVGDHGHVFLAANTTEKMEDAVILLNHGNSTLLKKTIDIDPGNPFAETLSLDVDMPAHDLKLSLLNNSGREIISYQPEAPAPPPPLPEAIVPPKAPDQIKTTEELYYTGMRIRQFHNARLRPEDYFLEALERDPMDVRCNTAMGIIHKERGEMGEAKQYLRKAIMRLTWDYTRPRDCEALYHLGVILNQEGNFDAAIDTLYRAAWDLDFRSASYFQLARLYSVQERYPDALEAAEQSLLVNAMNLDARCLKASLLRRTGKPEQAAAEAERILQIDHLNKYAVNELRLLYDQLGEQKEARRHETLLKHLLRDYAENYLELAVEYMNSGLNPEARQLLQIARVTGKAGLSDHPTIHYYLGYLHHLKGNAQAALEEFRQAGSLPVDYCFPFRLETLKVYQTALEYQPDDARAYYYTGNLLYDKQPQQAIKAWEAAVSKDPSMAVAHRNLGFGYFHAEGDIDKAIAEYETAISRDETQPKFYAELDRLYERRGDPLEKRLALLTTHHKYVAGRQDALLQEIKVLVQTGGYDRAIEYMNNTHFHRQEGAEHLHDLHVTAHLLRARESMDGGHYEAAIEDLLLADTYPENHLVGRDTAYDRNAQIYYYTGLAYELNRDRKMAREYYARAVRAACRNPENLYYKALAYQQLKEDKAAAALLDDIIRAGERQIGSTGEVDFFAKFGDEGTDRQRKANGYYLMGLGYLGRADTPRAKEYFEESVRMDVSQLWARVFLDELNRGDQ
jgi:tetratricopeptide (TPR) repeat protein